MTFTREIKFQLETADSQDRRQVSNISFAADLDAQVAVARSAILKFSVMPSTAAKLNSACFDGIGQSTDKNPDVLTQAIQDPAASDPPTPSDPQQWVKSVEAKSLSQENHAALINACVTGMVHSLDPDSYLYSKKDLELIARYNQDRWGEVWLQTEYQDGLPRIKYIPPSAKGYRAGLRVGDRIVMIDGEQLAPNDRVQFRRLIRGPEGSRTTLGILRDNKPYPIVIPVEHEMMRQC